MREWIFISIFGVIVLVFGIMITVYMVDTLRDEARFEEWVMRITNSIEERDERIFQLHNRVILLEEQRDIETRVTDLEKAARVYCTGTKTEMCGVLRTVK